MSVIKTLYYKIRVLNLIFYYPKKMFDFIRFRMISDSCFLKYTYKKYHKSNLNLSNPITLNEKIHWLKLFDRSELHTKCADKIEVREYVKEIIGDKYLIPMHSILSNSKEILAVNLPDYPHIIKTNNGCGSNLIVHDKETVNYQKVQKDFKSFLNYNHYYKTKEWQYKNIYPKIIIEKLLIDRNGELPNDIKFHCFNGKVEFIQVDIDRSINHKRNFYSKKWDLLDFNWCPKIEGLSIWTNSEKIIKQPTKLGVMIELSEKLSITFSYVRVDLYEFENNVYFGELTFHHGSGVEIFDPIKFDVFYGNKLKI